jgi:hypothetical protein
MRKKTPKRKPVAGGGATPPLTRHPALQPFSRDHHAGLVRSQQLLRAARGSADDRRAALAAFLAAWTVDIETHFDDEDRILGSLLGDDQRHHLAAQHREIRSLVQHARGLGPQDDPGEEWLSGLGQKLNDHIRWEERQLFPAVEQAVCPKVLEQLGEVTVRVEQSRPRSRVKA